MSDVSKLYIGCMLDCYVTFMMFDACGSYAVYLWDLRWMYVSLSFELCRIPVA